MASKIKEIIIKTKYSLLALISAFIIGVIILLIRNMLNDNNYIFMHSDMQSQMMPVLKMFIRQLLNGRSLQYSFSYGLGGNTIPIYTNGTCFSIFNLILLLPLKQDYQAFLLVISKLSFASFCFSELCRIVYKKSNLLTVAMSCSYALCSFNLAYYFVIIWQDGFYMLPIVILLIYKLINEKKCFLLILAYVYLFICNFYSGYVIGIFSFAFFVLFLLGSNNDNKVKCKLIFRYLLYVMTAVMISSIVLLPTAVALLTNNNSEATTFSEISVNIFDMFKQFYLGQYVIDKEKGLAPYIYCGILPFLSIPVFFINKKIERSQKIRFGLLLIILAFFILTKPGYIIIHAFNNPDNFGYRFGYVVSFVILLIMLEVLNYVDDISRKEMIIISFIYIMYILLYYSLFNRLSKLNNDDRLVVLLLNVVYIVLYVLFLYYKDKYKKQIMTAVSLVFITEIVINGILLNNMIDQTITENKLLYEYFYTEENELVQSLGNKYTRISMPNSITYNNSQLMGYRSVNAFSSFLNSNIRQVMRKMGYAASDLEVKDMGYTDISNMLMGVDYTLLTNDMGIKVEEPYIINNKALPIAFMVDDNIKEVNLSSNPFENLNYVLSGMMGEDINYYYNSGSNVQIDANNMIVGSGIYNEEEVVVISLDDSNDKYGYIGFYDNTCESKYCYFDMQDSYMYIDSPIVSVDLDGYRDAFDASYISIPHIVRMKQFDDKTCSYIIIDDKSSSQYYFNKAYFYGERKEYFDEIYNGLLSGAMNVTELKDGYVSGNVISSHKKSVLFTSIPYDNNWEVYIDGKKANAIALLEDAFLGVEIPDGEHYVEMKYKDKWLINGMWISALGIVVAIGILYSDKKIKAGDIKNEKN